MVLKITAISIIILIMIAYNTPSTNTQEHQYQSNNIVVPFFQFSLLITGRALCGQAGQYPYEQLSYSRGGHPSSTGEKSYVSPCQLIKMHYYSPNNPKILNPKPYLYMLLLLGLLQRGSPLVGLPSRRLLTRDDQVSYLKFWGVGFLGF